MRAAMWAALIAVLAAAAALSGGCAKTLAELAPFPCADDATCPDDFVCLPRTAVGDDTCDLAFDGVCHEPEPCLPFTDTSDCAALANAAPTGDDSCQFAFDDVCDEPDLCPPGTDTSDCVADDEGPESCRYARDGACDEPLLCASGTDSADCRSVPFCVASESADERRCDVDADCEPGLRCDANLCVVGGLPTECGLFDQAGCVDSVCAPLGSDAEGYTTTCVPFPNPLPPGSNCNDNGPSCGAGTVCYGDSVNGFFCFLLCDDAHPCPFGGCTLFPSETFGRCT